MMDKALVTASVRTIVEYALLSGDLLPGAQLDRMREGMLGHRARQREIPNARTEVWVKALVEDEAFALEVGGRIDALYERDGLTVVEEIKLSPPAPPAEVAPVHRAQAVCYGHMLGIDKAILRVLYVRASGAEVAVFEEILTADQLAAEFARLVAPFCSRVSQRLSWCALRDESIRVLPFPYDEFRPGQREMAAQAYYAVKNRKRLFAQAPTGTGKTAAALFPALKALGEGFTGQIFYLTARTTAQQSATSAIERMRKRGLRLRALWLTAKEKICPYAKAEGFRCDVLACPRAKGFFDRLPAALFEMRSEDHWAREAVERAADAHTLCPFEFALSLCEEADVVVCDYNYAFDPGVRLKRIFQWTSNVTLLVDEAHNLPDRAREMLSAALDSQALREVRWDIGKRLSRKSPLYRALTALIGWIEALPEGADGEKPAALSSLLEDAMDAAMPATQDLPLFDLTRALYAAQAALERFDERYAVLVKRQDKTAKAMLFCLDPAPHLTASTRKLRGCVFLSATLTPLSAWRDAIGGKEADGLLSLPSPFPWENLLVLRQPVSTRYAARDRTAAAVADAILAMVSARSGNYLACFPSYAYLRRVQEEMEARGGDVTLHVQRSGMKEEDRSAYLEAFSPRESGALLGLVVLGGVFGEGVDLPGERLSGVAVVGVGLPQLCPERELLRAYYGRALGDGFAHAYQYPGMNKVLQAVGRVIRTETDRGVALLIDDRFLTRAYADLMPPWWGEAEAVQSAQEIRERMQAFWKSGPSTR